MTLEEASKTSKPEKPEKVKDKALKVARKYVDLPYSAARNKIAEETPCSKASAHKALKKAQAETKQKPAELGATEPSVTIVKEQEKTPEFIEHPDETKEALETLTETGETTPAVAHLLAEGELTAEDMSFLFEAANDGIRMFNPKRAPSDKSSKFLGKLWVKPFNKWWSTVSEQNPLLAIAVIVTVIVYAPCLIGVIVDWRASREKKPAETKPSKE